MSREGSGIGPAGRVVAANVRGLRAAHGMTRNELAAALLERGRWIPPLGIGHVEAARRRVDVDDLVALAGVFGVEPAALLAAPRCAGCHGAPPAGFACLSCGAEGAQR